MSTIGRVRKLVAAQNLTMRPDGTLQPLDSIGVIDMVASLERTFSIHIPPEKVLPESFESVQAIAAFVDTLAER
jgi:acyl carrier protein